MRISPLATLGRLAATALPFADVGTPDLPLGRLLRLSLFQVSVGMAIVLIHGTVNRVMVVELGLPTSLVTLLIALPLCFAPLRALIGFRSDNYRSSIGWRRIPYIWIGTLLQFGGLALMPFGLLVLSDGMPGTATAGKIGLGLSFLLVGAGLHTVQTAGLALATDLAPPESRPRVVALLYAMLLVGTVMSALLFGWLLRDFSATRLIRCIHGAAVATFLFNIVGVWHQERRTALRPGDTTPAPTLRAAWRGLDARRRPARLLTALALGTAAFGMQDILLEPYGGQVFGLSVSGTTFLTAVMAFGTLGGFVLAARLLGRGIDAHLIAALGLFSGIPAAAAIVFAGPLESPALFDAGTLGVGFAGGLFAVGTLTAAMALGGDLRNGLALGLWGAVQATAGGTAIAIGGALRDAMGHWAASGAFGPALGEASAGYGLVYHVEIVLLFAGLAVIGPLVRFPPAARRAGRDAPFVQKPV
ncbi:MAG: BCD family MFS transporter [Janthinobacterium lividum]